MLKRSLLIDARQQIEAFYCCLIFILYKEGIKISQSVLNLSTSVHSVSIKATVVSCFACHPFSSNNQQCWWTKLSACYHFSAGENSQKLGFLPSQNSVVCSQNFPTGGWLLLLTILFLSLHYVISYTSTTHHQQVVWAYITFIPSIPFALKDIVHICISIQFLAWIEWGYLQCLSISSICAFAYVLLFLTFIWLHYALYRF